MKKINVYLLANAIAAITLNDEESKKDRIVFDFSFHHMDENGYYDGWTEYKLVITPSLTDGFDYKITGRDRNRIKEYLYDVFSDVFYYDVSVWYYDIVHGRVKVNR